MNKNVEVTKRDGQGKIIEIIKYDHNGNVIYHNNHKLATIFLHEYNDDGLIIKTSTSNGKLVTYKYRKGTNFIDQRIIFDPEHLPHHVIVEYEKGKGGSVYQYENDELKYIREYEEDDLYLITKRYSDVGILESTKYKYKDTGKLRCSVDHIDNIKTKFIYNEQGLLTKVVCNKNIINKYFYNEDGTIDYVLYYRYNRNGKLLEAVPHYHKYRNGKLIAIVADDKLKYSYTYRQLDL